MKWKPQSKVRDDDTGKRIFQSNDVGVVESTHGFGLLGDIPFQVLFFGTFFQGYAFYGIKINRIREFWGKDDVSKAAFSNFPNGLEMAFF